MINKRFFSFIVVLVFLFQLFGLAACTRDEEKKEAAGQHKELEKITIAQFGHVLVYLPIYVAEEKGFFKEQGLAVTYVSTGGDEKTFAAVISGSAQFGVADPTFIAIARERGNKQGQIIANIIDGVPFWGVSKSDRKISKIEDFANMRVATYPSPSTNFALMEKMIKGHNLNTRIVQGAFGTLLSILQNNGADMAMVLEPTTSLAEKQGYNVVFSYKGFYPDFAFTGLSTTTDYIKNHPEVCQKIVDALQKAYKYAYENFEGTVSIAKEQFPDFDDSVLRQGVRRMLDDETIPKSAVLKEKSWQTAIDTRIYIGDLQNNAPFRENVNNEFAEKAVRNVGEIQ
jgi:NitT/TauT family transport system substrate-binding protein